ncbi:MAG: hypothetical protein H3C36_05600 [Chitinophagaceae bacterium]|nr:hypothetical protein [Chitinophagaceae bacterium]MCZ2397424.1 hypothetical protein [Chitinophagales bacterium]
MLRLISFILLFSLCTAACTSNKKTQEPSANTDSLATIQRDTIPVFPVTDYLLGQISILEQSPVTLLKTTQGNQATDSVWYQREDAEKLAQPFLSPVIDSSSLQKYFKGNSFIDQTINAVTFTYTPRSANLPVDGLREINVYINPQSNEVTRIYLLKEKGDTTIQLTWKSGEWFSVRTISGSKVTEEKVKWNFNE